MSFPFSEDIMARKKHIDGAKMEEEKELTILDSEKESSELENLKLKIELEKAKNELEELRSKAKESSGRVVDEFEQAIIDRQIARTNENKTIKEKIRSQKAYDNVPVTGRFMNRRAPGQMAKLTYIKYEDDPVKWYEFYDGRTYTIPRGFADQINEHYHTPVFVQRQGPIENPDDPGSQIADVDTSNKKYAFVGLEY